MNLESRSVKSSRKQVIGDTSYWIVAYDRDMFEDSEWDEFLDYDDIYRLDDLSSYPLPSRRRMRQWMSETSDRVENHRWLILNTGLEIVGRLSLAYYLDVSDTNLDFDAGQVYIDILPAYRKKGIGSYLLKMAADLAYQAGKTHLESSYISDEAKGFSSNRMMKTTYSRYLVRLSQDDVDWDLMDDWASGHETITFSRVPDDLMADYCECLNTLDYMAFEIDGEVNDFIKSTPESIRETEEEKARSGDVDLTTIIRVDNQIVGMTKVYYIDNENWFVTQGLTGVLRAYQGRGYSKVLKGQMLLELRKRHPDFNFIETSNNINNQAILHVNQAMGFKKEFGESFTRGNVKEIIDHLS